MANELQGLRVAIVATDGFEQSELPAFCREMIRLFEAGRARSRQAAE